MSLEVSLKIFRYRPGDPVRYDSFGVTVPDAANVLDAIEQAWAHHDRSLMFRHACHHASCGACAVRVDGIEKMPCITPVLEVWRPGKTLVIEPLRNFPIVGDLVIDAADFLSRMEASGMTITRPAGRDLDGRHVELPPGLSQLNRFENCIECGICLSACPTMAADHKFFGPAGLAAIKRALDETDDANEKARLLSLADGEQGVWRCHSAWECTEACPQAVMPAEKIMALRREITRQRIKKFFGS